MAGNRDSTVYIGNLDERVTDRILYEICVQAGRIVSLHIPRDKDTNKPKGFAFAEYETEEIAEYAVKLFTGLVTLYNRTLKFGMSGQDKSAQKVSTTPVNTPNLSPLPRLRPHTPLVNHMSGRSSGYNSQYPQEPSPLGMVQSNGYGSNYNGKPYDYDRRGLGGPMYSSHNTPHESRNPIAYRPY